jgi:uncharacterized protein YcfL
MKVVLGIVIASLLIVGCGSKDKDQGSNADKQAAMSSSTPAASMDPSKPTARPDGATNMGLRNAGPDQPGDRSGN